MVRVITGLPESDRDAVRVSASRPESVRVGPSRSESVKPSHSGSVWASSSWVVVSVHCGTIRVRPGRSESVGANLSESSEAVRGDPTPSESLRARIFRVVIPSPSKSVCGIVPRCLTGVLWIDRPACASMLDQLGTDSGGLGPTRADSERLGTTRNDSERLGTTRNDSKRLQVTRNDPESTGITRVTTVTAVT